MKSSSVSSRRLFDDDIRDPGDRLDFLPVIQALEQEQGPVRQLDPEIRPVDPGGPQKPAFGKLVQCELVHAVPQGAPTFRITSILPAEV